MRSTTTRQVLRKQLTCLTTKSPRPVAAESSWVVSSDASPVWTRISPGMISGRVRSGGGCGAQAPIAQTARKHLRICRRSGKSRSKLPYVRPMAWPWLWLRRQRAASPICCRKVRLSSRCQEGRSFAEDAPQLVDQYPHARNALDVGVDDEPDVAVSARPAGARSTSDARISFSRRASPADRRGGEGGWNGVAAPRRLPHPLS